MRLRQVFYMSHPDVSLEAKSGSSLFRGRNSRPSGHNRRPNVDGASRRRPKRLSPPYKPAYFGSHTLSHHSQGAAHRFSSRRQAIHRQRSELGPSGHRRYRTSKNQPPRNPSYLAIIAQYSPENSTRQLSIIRAHRPRFDRGRATKVDPIGATQVSTVDMNIFRWQN
jgi:hypothetical protein